MRRGVTCAAGIAAFLFSLSSVADDAPASRPPMAKKLPKLTNIHGEKLQDDYFCLREKSNPEVRAHLEAENTYAEAFMKPTGTLQEKLYKEMLGRIKETDLSVP